MKRIVTLTCLAGVACLAFDTKDDPPPPPPVGHTIYCLSREEVTEALTLWLKEKKLPITGPVTFDRAEDSYVLYTERMNSSNCTPTPTPSKAIYLRIKVEYTKKLTIP